MKNMSFNSMMHPILAIPGDQYGSYLMITNMAGMKRWEIVTAKPLLTNPHGHGWALERWPIIRPTTHARATILDCVEEIPPS